MTSLRSVMIPLTGNPCKACINPAGFAKIRGLPSAIPLGDPCNSKLLPTRFTRLVFFFCPFLKLRLESSKNKNPAAGCGSNLALRREGDSNPRSHDCRTTVFETAAFDRSAISPSPALSELTKIIHISFD